MMRVSLSVTWWVSLIMWMVQKGSGPGAGLAGLLDLWACWPGLNLSKCFLRKVTHCMFTEQFQACVWATKMYLFFKQKPSCLALLVPVNLCGVQSKDRFPKMHCGERSPWEKRNWSLRAGLWILLDSWFSEVSTPFIWLTLTLFTATQLVCSRLDCSGSCQHSCHVRSLANGEPVPDKWVPWQRWHFWVLHWMSAAVWRVDGIWKWKVLTTRENEKCNLGPLDTVFLTVHLFSFSFSCSLSFLSFCIVSFLFLLLPSSPLLFLLLFLLDSRYRERDPCSPPREWEINPALPEQERLHVFGHCTAKAVNFRSDTVHSRTGT